MLINKESEVRGVFFSENDLSLELLGVFRIRRGRRALDSKNDRAYDSLSVRTDGVGVFKTERGEIEVRRGDVLYMPRNVHYSQTTSGETVYAVHFINYSFNPKNGIETLSVEERDRVVEMMSEMYRVWTLKKQGYRYQASAMLYSLLYFLNCHAHDDRSGAFRQGEQLKNAINRIHTDFRQGQIPISELAAMCAVSETYFRRLFKSIYGVSPNQYIINLRLEYASQLLCSGLYTVGEVSDRSGFGDPKYMSKLFKKRYGTSPRDYARQQPFLK